MERRIFVISLFVAYVVIHSLVSLHRSRASRNLDSISADSHSSDLSGTRMEPMGKDIVLIVGTNGNKNKPVIGGIDVMVQDNRQQYSDIHGNLLHLLIQDTI